MLNNSNAIATIGVKNLNKAKELYEKKLGFKPQPNSIPDEVQMCKCGDSLVEVYPGTNKTTVLSWVVSDIKSEVDSLKKAGIQFEHYDFPETKVEGYPYHGRF